MSTIFKIENDYYLSPDFNTAREGLNSKYGCRQLSEGHKLNENIFKNMIFELHYTGFKDEGIFLRKYFFGENGFNSNNFEIPVFSIKNSISYNNEFLEPAARLIQIPLAAGLLLKRILTNRTTYDFYRYANLNYIREDKLSELVSIINRIPDEQIQHVVFDRSIVLELFGIRNASDIDVLCDGEVTEVLKNSLGFDEYYASFHIVDYNDIVSNNSYHFEFLGAKFVTLDLIVEYKVNRSELKDVRDLSLICDHGYISRYYFYIKLFPMLLRNFLKTNIDLLKRLGKTLSFLYM